MSCYFFVILMAMQRSGICVKIMKSRDHKNGGNKHWNGTKKPEQQIQSKVECSETQWPKITSSYNSQFHTLNRNIRVGHGYEVVGVDKMPSRLNEARKGKKKTRQEGHVLDWHGGSACVSVYQIAPEEVIRWASEPSPNKGAECQRNRTEKCCCGCVWLDRR